MINHEIKAILFDLGETLLNFGKVNAGELLTEAGGLAYDFLRQNQQPVGKLKTYLRRNISGLRLRHLISCITGRDFDSLAVLKQYGTKRGIRLSQEQWKHVNWLWYEPLSRKASVEPDLVKTLTKLTDAGLKLGIVSNTFVHACTLDKHLAKEGLLDFFELRIYSYQLDFRKPDKRIFLEAARRMNVEPKNVLFVGDRINKDIKGALGATMNPVLKSAYTNTGKKPPDSVPVINAVSELPEMVEKINSRKLECFL